ncbi:alpha/beta hydrolase [Panacibacter ginsenosidivorans]|uniref:Alpha/beta hydrolase n=1 Tax=Panacibacter ginsenosidivorans TaxID=1813871 RepID=A0A5B8V3J2_9BACT|nr:alpha/beta hydrolase [Panacibacter ginsenosidivorans]QEC65944.1 alpha/beta hydrolase [Panacibacter ginsenosidivorans]
MIKTINKILAFSVIVFLAACNNTDESSKPIEVKNGITPISYSKTGKGDTALVFVHGWGINKEYWKSQVDAFSNRYTVVTIDLSGHGASGKLRSSYKIEDFSNDVMAVLDSLNLNKVILIGHSMGGDIILNVAYTIPERIVGFIGIDNFKDVGVPLTPQQHSQMDEFMHALSTNYKETVRAYCKTALFPPNYADTVSVNRVLNDVANTDSTVAIKALNGFFDFAPKETALLKELHKPVHLIVSDFTPMLQDSIAKYSSAGIGIKTIHGTGHYPMIEKPEDFNKLLSETLDEIAKGK